MIPHSIRGRFLLWLAFLLVCLLSGFGATVYQLQRLNRFKQIDEELELRVAALVNASRFSLGGPFRHGRPPFEQERFLSRMVSPAFSPGPPLGMPDRLPPRQFNAGFLDFGGPHDPEHRSIQLSAETARLFEGGSANDYYFALWSISGNELKRSTNVSATIACPAHLGEDGLTHVRTREDHREAIRFTDLGECVLVGRCIASDLRDLRRFQWLLLAVGATVLALGLGGAGWLATRAIRPIAEISATAEKIAAGDLSRRIPVPHSGSELGRLAEVLNSTFSQLDAAFERQRQFTADAAHELRTPISILLMHAQNGLAAECANLEHHEAFAACQRAAQRMRRLTQSLLELARLEAGEKKVARMPFDLSPMVSECVELIAPLAEERGLELHSDLAPLFYLGDRELLAQVVTNLLANAVQYSKPAGEVHLQMQREDDMAVIAIRDHGIGIGPEHLPHIFERFYRADASRSGGQGHAGLGLAVAKAIVQAHGGSIEAASEPGVGSTFTVRLPLGPEAKPIVLSSRCKGI